MVILWAFGDAFKVVYFIISEAPAQFLLCGSIQIAIDVIILGQWFRYKDNDKAKHEPRLSA